MLITFISAVASAVVTALGIVAIYESKISTLTFEKDSVLQILRDYISQLEKDIANKNAMSIEASNSAETTSKPVSAIKSKRTPKKSKETK